ncbi:MAG: SH3 domain-containing protein [Cyanothece sp. SIO1E1]|nr:SH3 domain-containing protein [Cyanothece sp. SIO1E1]
MRFGLILLVLIFLWSATSYARQNSQVMFDQANTLLEENDFMGALDSYRNIEQIGEISGPLYLNMGIAAMEIDSVGLAKYYFLKAYEFSVTRDQADEALEYVSSQFSRQSAMLPKLPWDRLVDNLKAGIGATGIFIIGFLMISISVIVIILNWFKSIEIPRKATIIATATSLSVLTVILAFYVDYVDQRYKEGVIIAKEIPVTTQPNENADLVSIAYEGYSITVDAFTSENAEGWYYIRLGNGQFGWIQIPGTKIL